MRGELKPGYKHTEVGVIPEDWAIGSLSHFWTVTDCKHVTAQFVDNGFPIVSIKEVQSRFVDLTNAKQTTQQFYNLLIEAGRKPRVGDLILSRNATVGEVAQVAERHPPFAMGQDVCLLRKKSPEFSTDYLQAVFRSPIIANQLSDLMVGSTFKRVNVQQIKNFTVPMPSPSEQEAIAEALSDAATLIESLEQLIAKKRQIKQGAMQELFTGKERLPGFSGEWEVKQFGDIAQLRKERIDPRRAGAQDFCIELEHIEQGTGCLAGFIAAGAGSSLKSVFKKGDVLFGKLRAYLRKYWLADRDGVCSTEIWVLVAKHSQVIPEFLFQLVKVDRFIEAASAAYGTHMPRSDWNVVKNYEVYLPSVEEQTTIAAILSDIDAEIAVLEAKLAKARQVKQGMMQELLTGKTRLVESSK
jgi:type I restriction enzyme S subunit